MRAAEEFGFRNAVWRSENCVDLFLGVLKREEAYFTRELQDQPSFFSSIHNSLFSSGQRVVMVRPKASDRNKTIAAYFADAMTVETSFTFQKKITQRAVSCRGQGSIFHALSSCLPNIIREGSCQVVQNREGITEIELNKVLVASGFASSRRRLWEKDQVTVHKEWFGRRWVDLSNPDDCVHVDERFANLKDLPECRSLTMETIKSVLSEMIAKSNLVPSSPKQVAKPRNQCCQTRHARFEEADDIREQRDQRWGRRRCREAQDRLSAGDKGRSSCFQPTAVKCTPTPYIYIAKVEHSETIRVLPAESDQAPPTRSVQVMQSDRDSPCTQGWDNKSMLDPSITPSQLGRRVAAQPYLSRGELSTEPSLPSPDLPQSAAAASSCPFALNLSSPGPPRAAPPSPNKRRRVTAEPCSEPRESDRAASAGDASPRRVPVLVWDRPGPLLPLAARAGWGQRELRRLCTWGYRAGPLWALLAALPADLAGVVRAALAGFDRLSQEDEGGLDSPEAGVQDGMETGVFGEVRAGVLEAMEADSEAGHIELCFDPRTQCRTRVFLTSRYAALVHAAARPAALALYAAHGVPLPGPEGDVLAAVIHDLLHRLDPDSEQFLRIAAGEGPAQRPALVCARTRKTFDGCGRIVKVRSGRAPARRRHRTQRHAVAYDIFLTDHVPVEYLLTSHVSADHDLHTRDQRRRVRRRAARGAALLPAPHRRRRRTLRGRAARRAPGRPAPLRTRRGRRQHGGRRGPVVRVAAPPRRRPAPPLRTHPRPAPPRRPRLRRCPPRPARRARTGQSGARGRGPRRAAAGAAHGALSTCGYRIMRSRASLTGLGRWQ